MNEAGIDDRLFVTFIGIRAARTAAATTIFVAFINFIRCQNHCTDNNSANY